MWLALVNENRVEKDILTELGNRQLVKRHNDLQAMVEQRELTQQFSQAYGLLKGQIKDLNDKLGIKEVVEVAEAQCEKPNKILGNLKYNLNQYNFSHEAPSIQKARQYEADLSQLIGRTGVNEFNRQVSKSIVDDDEIRPAGKQEKLLFDTKSGYGGAKFKRFGVDFNHSDLPVVDKEPNVFASPSKNKKVAQKKPDTVTYSQRLSQKTKQIEEKNSSVKKDAFSSVKKGKSRITVAQL